MGKQWITCCFWFWLTCCCLVDVIQSLVVIWLNVFRYLSWFGKQWITCHFSMTCCFPFQWMIEPDGSTVDYAPQVTRVELGAGQTVVVGLSWSPTTHPPQSLAGGQLTHPTSWPPVPIYQLPVHSADRDYRSWWRWWRPPWQRTPAGWCWCPWWWCWRPPWRRLAVPAIAIHTSRGEILPSSLSARMSPRQKNSVQFS